MKGIGLISEVMIMDHAKKAAAYAEERIPKGSTARNLRRAVEGENGDMLLAIYEMLIYHEVICSRQRAKLAEIREGQ